ncbi:MAG: hypothetical protein AAFP04_01685 [Myxococcota bacterium]
MNLLEARTFLKGGGVQNRRAKRELTGLLGDVLLSLAGRARLDQNLTAIVETSGVLDGTYLFSIQAGIAELTSIESRHLMVCDIEITFNATLLDIDALIEGSYSFKDAQRRGDLRVECSTANLAKFARFLEALLEVVVSERDLA